MECDYCKMDPGPHPANPITWFGIRDKDTGQMVCRPCLPKHYKNKFENPDLKGKYFELPVIYNPE